VGRGSCEIFSGVPSAPKTQEPPETGHKFRRSRGGFSGSGSLLEELEKGSVQGKEVLDDPVFPKQDHAPIFRLFFHSGPPIVIGTDALFDEADKADKDQQGEKEPETQQRLFARQGLNPTVNALTCHFWGKISPDIQ